MRPSMNCAKNLTQILANFPSLIRLLFVFQAHCCLVFVLFCPFPNQSRCLDSTRMKFMDPKGRFLLGGQRGPPKNLHGGSLPWFPPCVSVRVTPLSFCHTRKGSSGPMFLEVWSQEHHQSPLGFVRNADSWVLLQSCQICSLHFNKTSGWFKVHWSLKLVLQARVSQTHHCWQFGLGDSLQ